jgi:hypothetical protein
VEEDRSEIFWWYKCGLIRLHLGDMAGYRKACARAVEQFGKTRDPAMANEVAWLCALGPDAVPDLAAVVGLSENAVKQWPDAGFVHTLGYVFYRAGRYKEAEEQLRVALDAMRKGQLVTQNWFALPMTMFRSGMADEARKLLAQITKAIDLNQLPSWTDRLEILVLRREAEELLKGPPPKEGK